MPFSLLQVLLSKHSVLSATSRCLQRLCSLLLFSLTATYVVSLCVLLEGVTQLRGTESVQNNSQLTTHSYQLPDRQRNNLLLLASCFLLAKQRTPTKQCFSCVCFVGMSRRLNVSLVLRTTWNCCMSSKS